jgi:lipoate-protein ligase A
LRSQTGLDRVDVIDRMVDSFRNRYGLGPGTIDAGTVDRAVDLVASKFGTEEWLTRVP